MRMKNCWLLCVVVMLVVTFAGVDRALAAAVPVDLADTNWAMPCTGKASVSRVGRISGYLPTVMGFDGDSFNLCIDVTVDDQVCLVGDYSTNKKGKVTITEDDIDEDQLDAMMETILDIVVMQEGDGEEYEINAITDFKVKITATPKRMIDKKNSNQETIKLTVSGKISAKVVAQYYDSYDELHTSSVKVSLSFKAVAYRNNFAITASQWVIPCKYGFSVKRLSVSKVENLMGVTLDLGAKAADDDSAIFIITDGDGNGFSGTYTSHKNKYILYPYIQDLGSYFEEIIAAENENQDFELYEVEVPKKYVVTGKLKTKKGEQTMALKVAVTCLVKGTEWDDEEEWEDWVEHKGSLEISGKNGVSPTDGLISAHVFEIEMSLSYDYGEGYTSSVPVDYQLDAWMRVDGTVVSGTVETPEGVVYPAEMQVDEGENWLGIYVESALFGGLADFTDGVYIFTVTYANGLSQSTTIPFEAQDGSPLTVPPRPVMTAPVHGGNDVPLIVNFLLDPSNMTNPVWTYGLEYFPTDDDSSALSGEFDNLPNTTTTVGPVDLSSNTEYEVELTANHAVWSTNEDDIPYVVDKDSEVEIIFTTVGN